MIPEHIAALIPGCEEGRLPRAVRRLPGGRGCNLVLRVDTDAGSFVLRQRQPPLDRPGAMAMTELRCQMAAAARGLAPRVIQAGIDGSWMLMDFIDAPTWTEQELLSARGAEHLGRYLAQLHCLEVPRGVPPLDATGIATGYLAQLRGQNPLLAAQLTPLADKVRDLSASMARMALPAVLNHGDLQPGNMLGPEPVLCDWEYAQVADPTYDIACLLTYYPAIQSELPLLMASAGLAGSASSAALGLQQERFACLNQLWDAVNTPKGG